MAESANPIIDFGAHLKADQGPPEQYTSRSLEMLGDIVFEPSVVKEFYDQSLVDRAVLSNPHWMGHSDAEATAEANDAMAEVTSEYEMFYGLASLPMNAGGDAAAAEFERSLDIGLNGGAVEARTDGVELVNEAYEPVFEVAVANDAPIFVHPKLRDSLGVSGILDDAYKLTGIFGREVGLCESICKVIHTGVYDRYPDLTLVFHHSGGNIASFLGRARTYLDKPRWTWGEKAKDWPEFRADFDNVYIDSSGYFDYPAPFRTALEELPSTNIVLGTDVPYEPRESSELDDRVVMMREVASDEDAERVLSTNALDILVNV